MGKIMVFHVGNTSFEVSVTDFCKVQAAYDFIVTLYEKRRRDNGEPFLWHPLSTVHIMQNVFGCTLSDDDVVTALLHDALWIDCKRTQSEILSMFGENVLNSVVLLTKPHIVEGRSKQKDDEEVQFARLLQSGRKDLLYIKYAERLHNMLELNKTNRLKRENFLAVTKSLYIDRFPEGVGLGENVQKIFKEKYYEIIAQHNI